ncbi:MAG: hypothetical protein KDC33_06995 [Thermoleophilia bacterium]|nr:hypothetical protein [Thermoleophilia bacterium]
MKGYRTKKIALPGGRVIEIVYFSDPEPGDTPSGDADAKGHPADVSSAVDLHVCESCSSDLVYPVSWDERSDDTWFVERRCPNCEWRHEGEFHQSEVELFDDVLNDGTERLLTRLREYSRANMEEDVERLIAALDMDLIQPMDF